METSQIVLILTLLVAIAFMIVVGIQVYLTLTEFRKTLNRVNGYLDNFEQVGSNVEHGFREFLGFFGGFRTLLSFVEKISDRISERKNQ